MLKIIIIAYAIKIIASYIVWKLYKDKIKTLVRKIKKNIFLKKPNKGA